MPIKPSMEKSAVEQIKKFLKRKNIKVRNIHVAHFEEGPVAFVYIASPKYTTSFRGLKNLYRLKKELKSQTSIDVVLIPES